MAWGRERNERSPSHDGLQSDRTWRSQSGTAAASFDPVTEFSPTNPDDYLDCSKTPTEGARLHTKSGVTYDFETKRLYYVTVTARDPSGLTDSIEVTVAPANDEGPTKPEARL